jgi:hypothetical protein
LQWLGGILTHRCRGGIDKALTQFVFAGAPEAPCQFECDREFRHVICAVADTSIAVASIPDVPPPR